MIEFRGGATATNLPQKPFEAHMHNIIWRVNVDLNGAKNNVSVVRHIENTNSPTWRDVDRALQQQSRRFDGVEPARVHDPACACRRA